MFVGCRPLSVVSKVITCKSCIFLWSNNIKMLEQKLILFYPIKERLPFEFTQPYRAFAKKIRFSDQQQTTGNGQLTNCLLIQLWLY